MTRKQRATTDIFPHTKLHHVAVCVDDKGTRVGFVVSDATLSAAVKRAEAFANRIGYVGGDDFATAVRRAGMMERNESGAWGSL